MGEGKWSKDDARSKVSWDLSLAQEGKVQENPEIYVQFLSISRVSYKTASSGTVPFPVACVFYFLRRSAACRQSHRGGSLMSDEKELSEYFERLKNEFEQNLRNHIAWHYPSLSEADIDDVYQDTMYDMLVRWRQEPNKREDWAVGGFLKKIARRKAYNLINRRPIITGTNLDVASTGYRDDPFIRYADPLEREELANLIVEAYDLMDDDQQRVWYAFATNYPASRKHTRLAVFAGMPGQPRRASRLLKSAQDIMIRHLKKKGYDLD